MKTLSLESLIGTNLLRAYMHGYFIDNRLYQKAKSAANPFAHEEFVAKQIEKDIDEEAKRKPIKKKVKYRSNSENRVYNETSRHDRFEDIGHFG